MSGKFGKFSSGHKTGKCQFSLLSQRKVMPKYVQTIAQLHSSCTLAMLKILQSTLQQYVNRELPNVQVGFRKSRRTRDQIGNIWWIIERAREFQKDIYFCFIDYAKASDCVDHHKLWKILNEMGIPDHLTCLLRNLYAGQEAIVRTRHGIMDCSTLGKEYVKAVYCHPDYLTYMHSTLCEMPDWMKHKLELRLLQKCQ